MKQIFINLPVKDVEASMQFYLQIGFTFNPLFSFDDQKCMVWCEQVYVMLQTHEMFRPGIKKNLADATTNTIATFTLPVESIERMNEMVQLGLQAGATEPAPARDEGFMQLRNLEDPDGHNWAIICLDLEKFKQMRGRE